MIGQNTNTTIATPAATTRKVVKKQFTILKHKRQLLTILTLLFICVIFWGIVSLFSSQQVTKVDAKLQKLSTPITPNLDLETLNTLEAKRSFTDDELANFPIYRLYTDPRTREDTVIPIDEPLPTVTPRATPRPAATQAPAQTAQ